MKKVHIMGSSPFSISILTFRCDSILEDITNCQSQIKVVEK